LYHQHSVGPWCPGKECQLQWVAAAALVVAMLLACNPVSSACCHVHQPDHSRKNACKTLTLETHTAVNQFCHTWTPTQQGGRWCLGYSNSVCMCVWALAAPGQNTAVFLQWDEIGTSSLAPIGLTLTSAGLAMEPTAVQHRAAWPASTNLPSNHIVASHSQTTATLIQSAKNPEARWKQLVLEPIIHAQAV
jgi:hypothetical protein